MTTCLFSYLCHSTGSGFLSVLADAFSALQFFRSLWCWISHEFWMTSLAGQGWIGNRAQVFSHHLDAGKSLLRVLDHLWGESILVKEHVIETGLVLSLGGDVDLVCFLSCRNSAIWRQMTLNKCVLNKGWKWSSLWRIQPRRVWYVKLRLNELPNGVLMECVLL